AGGSRAATRFRSAARTSTSSRCGTQTCRAAAISAVAHAPRSLPSMSKSTSSDASETIIELAVALLARFANELCRGNPRTHQRPAPYTLDHLLERGPADELDDVSQEVFRERHPLARRPFLERAMDVLRHVSDLDVTHAFHHITCTMHVWAEHASRRRPAAQAQAR